MSDSGNAGQFDPVDDTEIINIIGGQWGTLPIPGVYPGPGPGNDNTDASGGQLPRGESGSGSFAGNNDLDFANVGFDDADAIASGERQSYIDMASAMFPSMPQSFIWAFAEQWMEYADLPNAVNVAMVALRQDKRYEEWFPGNLRDDGTVHVSEVDYWNQRAMLEQAVNGIGLDPAIFSDEQYISLISGDVSVNEFRDRVRTQANQVLARSEEFRSYYSELYGFAPSDTAILQSAFTGTNDALLRQAGIAAVGFEGERREFDVALGMAASLYDAGITSQGQAAELFGEAATSVPLFGTLAARHFDPDDTFDLGEFLAAAVFDDTREMRRMQRLLAAERSLFANSGAWRTRGDAMIGLSAE